MPNWAALACIAPAAFLMQKDRKEYLGKSFSDAGFVGTEGGN
jgi:hypothetical protein